MERSEINEGIQENWNVRHQSCHDQELRSSCQLKNPLSLSLHLCEKKEQKEVR